mmetsp:Transcript_42072/g.110831  ORF Transcript_42072/g.110831 Transcript_42072/m.110831 type:complete len:226 (-) Transcript_42072:303-980(-)
MAGLTLSPGETPKQLSRRRPLTRGLSPTIRACSTTLWENWGEHTALGWTARNHPTQGIQKGRRLHSRTPYAGGGISPHQATGLRWPVPFQIQVRRSWWHEHLLLLRLLRPEATQRLAQSHQAAPARHGFACTRASFLFCHLGLSRRSRVSPAIGPQKLHGLRFCVAHVQRTDRWADGGDDGYHGPGDMRYHTGGEQDHNRLHAGGEGQVRVGVIGGTPLPSLSCC